jgi:hypothetical protein
MTIEQFSKQLIEKSLLNLAEKTGKCNSTGAGTSCPAHGDADCNSSKQNRSEGLMADELDGTTYEVVMEDGETVIIEKIKGADGKACWKGYKYAGTENGKDKCVKSEEKDYLPGSQEKLDANKNGKLDADDFKKLRGKKGKTVKEMWQVSEGKKVEIEIMPTVDTPNDPEPPAGKKSTEDIKRKMGKQKSTTTEQVDLEEKKLSAKEKAKKEKVVKGMKKKFGKMKSKYGDKAQSVMYGAATNMAKKSA